MESITATNAHSPSNLVTEDYEFVATFDTGAPMWAESDWAKEMIERVHATNRDRGMNQCHHCGAHIRYVAVMEHIPTGQHIAVGETCLENRFARATSEFQKMRKQAKLDAKQQRIRKLVNECMEANPGLEFLAISNWDKRKEAMPEASKCNSFLHDIATKLNRYGSLSAKQIEAARKSLVRDEEYAAKKAAKVEAPPAGPVPTGKALDIEGTVISRKQHETQFGTTMKLTVELANGSRIWFTEPRSGQANKGDTIKVRLGEVQASDKDASFGFGKRPTRFEVFNADGTKAEQFRGWCDTCANHLTTATTGAQCAQCVAEGR